MSHTNKQNKHRVSHMSLYSPTFVVLQPQSPLLSSFTLFALLLRVLYKVPPSLHALHRVLQHFFSLSILVLFVFWSQRNVLFVLQLTFRLCCSLKYLFFVLIMFFCFMFQCQAIFVFCFEDVLSLIFVVSFKIGLSLLLS